MKSYFVRFNWKLRTPAKHFNSGTTVIGVDAESADHAKAKARLRFPDQILRFTEVKEFSVSSR